MFSTKSICVRESETLMPAAKPAAANGDSPHSAWRGVRQRKCITLLALTTHSRPCSMSASEGCGTKSRSGSLLAK